jgi:hypothetical protein
MKTIFRVYKNPHNPFVMMDKRPLENPKLSYKAKGMLAYLLSRPDNWKINLQDLINRSSDGRDGVKSGLKELENAGHITIHQERDDKGKFRRVIYSVLELPLTEKPLTEKPLAEKPLNNNININTKNNGTDIDSVTCELLKCWRHYFPDKRQPKQDTYLSKVKTRVRDKDFLETFKAAVEYAQGRAVGSEAWFTFEWLLRNDNNVHRICTGEFDWKDKKTNGGIRSANLDIWDEVTNGSNSNPA